MSPSFGEHHRVVGGRVRLGGDDAADEARGLRGPSRAPAPRSAASRRPGRACSRRATRGSRCARAARAGWRRRPPGRRTDAPRGCADRTGRPSRGGRRSSAPAITSAARARRSAPASASASTAVEACVPLMSARPSLGPSRTGESPAAGERVRRPATCRSPSHARPSPTSTRARCASGARSPLAPTDPRDGTTGCTPRFSASSSASSVSTRMPEKPRARTFARSAIIARTVRTGSGSPDAGRVAAQQVELQALERVGRDAHLGERPEAGVDPVDGRVAGRHAVHHRARGGDARTRVGRQRDRCAHRRQCRGVVRARASDRRGESCVQPGGEHNILPELAAPGTAVARLLCYDRPVGPDGRTPARVRCRRSPAVGSPPSATRDDASTYERCGDRRPVGR